MNAAEHCTNQIWVGASSILEVSGADALDFLHRLSTQDLRGKLSTDGASTTTAFTTAQGRLVEWCRIFRVEAERYLLVCHRIKGSTLLEWIDKYIIIEDVEVQDASSNFVHLEVGADAPESVDIPATGAFHIAPPPGRLLRSEWLISPTDAEALNDIITGDELSREWLRLLAGEPSPQFEYQKETNALELNLLHDAIGWNKGCYIGQEVISRLDSYDKVARGLMGFECLNGTTVTPVAGDKLVSSDGKNVGKVTSSMKGGSDQYIGLAVVARQWSEGSEVSILSSDQQLSARLVQRSFGRKD